MGRFTSAVLALFIAAAWLPACGSSDSGESKPPAATQPAPAPAPGPQAAAAAKPAPKPTQEQKQELLDLMVWTSGGQPRDKLADAHTCQQQNDNDPTLKNVHGLVVVQHWIQCMEKLGWTRKQEG